MGEEEGRKEYLEIGIVDMFGGGFCIEDLFRVFVC